MDPDSIASCALQHYQEVLGSAGKPKEQEWTVYAAIVAHRCCSSASSWVVSSATGSKCTNVGPEGWVLRDTHAEVLCRRGLVRELWNEVLAADRTASTDAENTAAASADNKASSSKSTAETAPDHRHHHYLLEPTAQNTINDTTTFRLRPDITLHLYISDSPCGDASIYPLHGINEQQHQFTGAKKVMASAADTLDSSPAAHILPGGTVAREPHDQELGVLRTKSGRSNLPEHLRSHCMSCSDKILRWCLLGLQGELLLHRLGHARIYLSSICVSADPRAASMEAQRNALQRAVVGRAQAAVDELRERTNLKERERIFIESIESQFPSVHVVKETFARGKAVTEATLYAPIEQPAGRIPDDNSDQGSSKETEKHQIQQDESSRPLKRQKLSSSPCGFSLNWQQYHKTAELVVGGRGIRQGKKPKCDEDYKQLASRLSRAQIMIMAGGKGEYQTWKMQHQQLENDSLRDLVFSTRPFQAWLVTKKDFFV